MNAGTPTVFLVDDDASFLTSAARLLRASGFSVSTYPSASALLAGMPADAAGCVLADLQMPGMNGAELQDALLTGMNPLPLVFLTGHGEVPDSVRAMRRGAEDFLTKRAPKEALIEAVRRALARDTREREERARRRELRARFDPLTPREREVLAHVLTGQLNKQIAGDLGIDERSVKRHRSSLMVKLQVDSVAALAHLVHEAGLAPR